MKHQISKRDSISIYIIKAFAMLSVIAAHVVEIDNSTPIELFISYSWKLYGQVGVFLFFFFAGYCYQRTSNDGFEYWKRKLRFVIIPWIMCSTLTYILNYIKRMTSAESRIAYCWPQWVLGSGTWYYFVTEYVLFLFIFKFLAQKDIRLVLCIAITPISLVISSMGIMTKLLTTFCLTQYLNPFNWIGIFALGIIIRKYNIRLCRKLFILILEIIAGGCAYYLCKQKIFTYFHPISLLFELICALLIIQGVYFLYDHLYPNGVLSMLEMFGKNSYFSYLLHMQIVQAFCRNLSGGTIKQLFSPVLGALLMFLLLNIIVTISRTLHLHKFLFLIGIKY